MRLFRSFDLPEKTPGLESVLFGKAIKFPRASDSARKMTNNAWDHFQEISTSFLSELRIDLEKSSGFRLDQSWFNKRSANRAVYDIFNGETDGLEYVEALINETNHVLWRRRAMACLGLCAAHAIDHVSLLIGLLRDDNRVVRRAARFSLVNIGLCISSSLQKSVEDQSRLVRKGVFEIFGLLQDPAGIPLLINGLNDPEWIVREAACGALTKYGDSTNLINFEHCLYDSDAGVRFTAVRMIARSKKLEMIDKLRFLTRDADASVRCEVFRAFGLTRSLAFAPELLEGLNDKSYSVRVRACTALGRIGAISAYPAVVKCLKGPSKLRAAACITLGKIGEKKAIRILFGRLSDKRSCVRKAAVIALGKLGEQDAALAFFGSLEGDTEALTLLLEIPEEKVAWLRIAFEKRLRDRCPKVKKGAIKALALIGDLTTLDLLGGYLHDDNPAVSVAAGRAVRSLQSKLSADHPHLFCLKHASRFERRIEVGLSGVTSRFVCKTCGGAGEGIDHVEKVVAVLDNSMKDAYVLDDGVAHINALDQKYSFDFDEVEIRFAIDQDVEQFCQTVANDTDWRRRMSLGSIPLRIHSDLSLSENTLRILEQTFSA